ncbi:hypothetical protein VKT23_016528 [Stygiomarasmius scandens]|uniref:HMG box domain-containing protein n=1 Tax=Marasmiellus scandens TaxID=2682957 RepID=A0ABR1IW55_9AGAR
MSPTRHTLTHLQSRRRSSIAKITKAKYTQVPTPARLTFYPNVTPTTYVSQEQQDAQLDQLALAGFPSSSTTTPEPCLESAPVPTLFPPSLAPSTGPTRKRRPPGKRPSQGYIPRPPNAFMLFRADFVRQKHVPGSIETNHGSLSKIIGSCWRSLPPKDKQHWEVLARKEKQAHKERYPDYKFRPVHKKRKKALAEAAAKSAQEEFDDLEAFSDNGDDAEYDPSFSSNKLKRKAPTPAAASSSLGKMKPASNVPLTIENAPSSTYHPSSYRFAYATLREQRQEFIINCLVQGITKKPTSSDLGLPTPAAVEPQGGYLEDHVERWEKERGYVSLKVNAEKEDKDEKDHIAATLAASVKVKPETRAQTKHKSMLGHRRSSSVPLPDEFVHHHQGMQFQQQHQHPCAVGYYPQQHFGGFFGDFDQIQQGSYAQDGFYTQNTNSDAYTPFTNSNWGTSTSPEPGNGNGIALPSLPSALAHGHSSGSMPPPSPTPSALSSSGVSNGVYSARPSFGQYFTGVGGGWGSNRVSLTGRSLLGQRRASSAQPCLASQYHNSNAFSGLGQDSGMNMWGNDVWNQTQNTDQTTQNMEPEMNQEDMDALDFDPSAMAGWNPNFTFGGLAGPTSASSSSVHSATPPLMCSDASSEASFNGASAAVAGVEFNPAFGFQSQPQTSVVSSGLTCTTDLSGNVGVGAGVNMGMGMGMYVDPLVDPLEPSPISAVSSISSLEEYTPGTTPVVHAPQPITPVQHSAMDVDQVQVQVSAPSPTPTTGSSVVVAAIPADDEGAKAHIDSQQVFTDLWKGLSSSQSFCMGMGAMAYRPSVALGGDANVSSIIQNGRRDDVEEDEEEEGEFERALKREHMELVASGGR